MAATLLLPPSPFHLQQPSANVINLFLLFFCLFFACTLSPWPSPFGFIFSGTARHNCRPSLHPPGLSFKYDLMAAPKRQGASSLALASLALRGLLNQLGSCRAQQDNTLSHFATVFVSVSVSPAVSVSVLRVCCAINTHAIHILWLQMKSTSAAHKWHNTHRHLHTHMHTQLLLKHTVITLLAPATALCVCIETNKVGSIHKAVKAVTKFGLVLCSLLSGAT